ncbi:hypothetical protein BCR36DRAFT_327290 [Piromyces finnis]|uniref:Uncharacterized protein n=1 Tax=Piromyces finnis TaxID=1754191 RepID=A0A1Y1VAS2_9FUNG|nr:hypothetical protein BCR36DRAFT_327290 [Piromyces finnis]|eukprot:ORX50425.1 hypothetical protein BCR36DRAFT_327290 [Piromyces finnis]
MNILSLIISNLYIIVIWLCFNITIIVHAFNNDNVVLGFIPSEIETHGINESCSHLHNKNSYQIKKFKIDIGNDKNKNSITSLFSKFAKYIVGQSEEEQNNNQNQNFIALEQPFEVVYQCDCDDIYCERIKDSFEKVPGYFTSALDIYSAIKIRLNIFSFSQSEKRKNSTALAITSPPPYIILKDSENGWPFSYPYTLIKQLNTNIKIQYDSNITDYDINIDINTDQMMNDKYFTSMLAHEILHGMGIYYIIKPLSKMIPDFEFSPELIMPPIDYNVYENEEGILKEIKTFLPPSIYEKNFINLEKLIKNKDSNDTSNFVSPDYYLFNEDYYLAFRDLKLKYYIHQPMIDDSEKTQLQQFNETLFHWKGYSIAHNFYKSATSENGIGFLTNEGDIIKLQTYNNEYSGDFFHVSTPYHCESISKCSIEDETDHHLLKYGPNFVMLSKYYVFDMTVEEKIEAFAPNNRYGLLGDGIVHMLTTMGWTERNSTRNNKNYIVLNSEELENLQIVGPVHPNTIELKLDHNQSLFSLISSDSNISFQYTPLKCIILTLVLTIIFLF